MAIGQTETYDRAQLLFGSSVLMIAMNVFPLSSQLELVALGEEGDDARAVATSLGGVAYVDERPHAESLPFRTLVRAVTDDIEALASSATVGLYVVCARTKKSRSSDASGRPEPRTGPVTINAMIHHPDQSHRQSDAYWRDGHGPLALRIHVGMADYTQLSVLSTIAGTPYDGFAILGFDSEDDLKNRFYATPGDKHVIYDDVAKFSDLKRSPRRLVAMQYPNF